MTTKQDLSAYIGRLRQVLIPSLLIKETFGQFSTLPRGSLLGDDLDVIGTNYSTRHNPQRLQLAQTGNNGWLFTFARHRDPGQYEVTVMPD